MNNNTSTAKACTPENRKPKAGHRRPRVLIQVLIMCLCGAVVFFWFNHTIIAGVIWFLACLLLFGFVFSPAIVRGFDRFGLWLGHFVGTAMTYILLVPMFYIVFTFGKLVITTLGRDPLQRKWQPERPSYWDDRAPSDPTHFKRQY